MLHFNLEFLRAGILGPGSGTVLVRGLAGSFGSKFALFYRDPNPFWCLEFPSRFLLPGGFRLETCSRCEGFPSIVKGQVAACCHSKGFPSLLGGEWLFWWSGFSSKRVFIETGFHRNGFSSKRVFIETGFHQNGFSPSLTRKDLFKKWTFHQKCGFLLNLHRMDLFAKCTIKL